MMMADNELPTRSFMDDPNIKWAEGVPDYTSVNREYIRGKTRQHAADSMEKLVENIVKTFEMEIVHKLDPSQWETVDHSVDFYLRTNGRTKITIDMLLSEGNYKAFLWDSALFDKQAVSKKRSFDMFHSTFPAGFPWEVLEVLSGPPTVAFTWRHWGTYAGNFGNRSPTGKIVDLQGCAVAKVNSDLKLQSVEFYFDPNDLIAQLTQFDIKDWTKCPFHRK